MFELADFLLDDRDAVSFSDDFLSDEGNALSFRLDVVVVEEEPCVDDEFAIFSPTGSMRKLFGD